MPVPSAAVEAVWRIESGRLVAALTRITGDFAAAEDLAQDALERALRQWPVEGIPEHPPAWLMATAKHLAVDAYRRRLTLTRKLAELARETTDAEEGDPMAAVDQQLDTVVPDDLLRLVFLTCHPALTTESQVALTLRTIGGLPTREIARAFLVPEPTVGQRISRAKKTLADRRARFELPLPTELPTRLGAVLAVVYLIFNEGYAATSGHDWTRPELCQDALRLGRLLAGLRPDEPEVHGLVALMELQASRIPARTGPSGEPVLLRDQDRRRWDPLLLRRGLAALEAAESLGYRPLHSAGRDRRLPRARHERREHRLAPDRRPLHGPASPRALPRRRPQPRRRRRHGRRTGQWAGPDAAADQRAEPGGLPRTRRRPRDVPAPAGSARRGPCAVPASCAKHNKHRPASPLPPPGRSRGPRDSPQQQHTVIHALTFQPSSSSAARPQTGCPPSQRRGLTDCDDQPATPLDHGRHRTVSSTSPGGLPPILAAPPLPAALPAIAGARAAQVFCWARRNPPWPGVAAAW